MIKKWTAAEDISTHTLTWSVTTLPVTPFTLPVISTHTLTWSVTEPVRDTRYAHYISTHTLTWSVTILPLAG